MSTRTEYYQLHQWVPEDSFLRTDFNEDNAVLDAAVHQAQTQADRAVQRLIPVSYNVYQLILQNYYEGKYTGYKQALLFDGFLDTEGIASRDEALCHSPGELALTNPGQSDLVYGYSSSYSLSPSRTFTPTYNGRLTGLDFRIKANGTNSNEHVTITVTDGDDNVLISEAMSFSIDNGTTYDKSYTFSLPIEMVSGKAYKILISYSPTQMCFYYGASDSYLGGTLHITRETAAEASMTTVPHSVPACGTLEAWIRHQGGTVALSLTDSGGITHDLTAGDTADTVNLEDGSACTETAFSLDVEIPEGDAALTLTVALGADSKAEVFDYGLILI